MASTAVAEAAFEPIPFPRRIRLLLALGFGMIAVVAATGVVANHVFAQPTTLKYLVTVFAPLLLGVICLAEDPLPLALGATVITAPWNLDVTFTGVELSPLTVLLPLAVLLVLVDPRRTRGRPTTTGIVVVAAVALLLPAFAIGREQPHYLTWIACTLVAGWLAFQVAQRPGGLRLILSLLVVAATVQGVVTFYEYARHANLNLYTSEVNQAVSQTYYFNFGTQFRPAGLLPDPDSLGNILALALPLAFVLALGASTRMARFAWVACAAVIAVALTLSFSRASWIGAAAGIVLALIALPPRGRARGLLGASVLLVVTVVIGLAIGGGSLTERFASIENPTARTVRTAQGDEERKRVWSAALAIASAHPVVGVGMGRLQEHLSEHLGGAHEGVHAQSVYLQFLAQSGAVGLLALLLLVGHAATGVWRGFRSERLFMAGVGGAVVAMLIGWTTDTTARYTCVSVVLAFLLGAAMAQHWTTENDATPLGT